MGYEILGACRRLDIDTPLIDRLAVGPPSPAPTTWAPIIRNRTGDRGFQLGAPEPAQAIFTVE